MAQERCHELAEEVCLPVGSQADTSQMARLQASAQETVGCPGNLEVAIRVYGGPVRKLNGVNDSLVLDRLELILAESG